MVNRSLLAAKWTELAERLSQVRRHRKPSVEGFESDFRPLHRAASEGVDDLDAFARAVTQWASSRTSC